MISRCVGGPMDGARVDHDHVAEVVEVEVEPSLLPHAWDPTHRRRTYEYRPANIDGEAVLVPAYLSEGVSRHRYGTG